MRAKAIQDLSQLADDELFVEIEIGAALCLSNALQIQSDAQSLDDLQRPAGAEILRLSAEEEAAKVLILLDVVRIDRTLIARRRVGSRGCEGRRRRYGRTRRR